MIFSYNEFLVEKVLQMINESEVVYSKKFRKLLKDIESPISKHLVEIENKDINVSSNYFDISDNKDTFSFISDRKAQEIIGNGPKYAIYRRGNPLTHNIDQNGKIFDLLGYVPKGTKSYQPSDDEKGEILKKAISPVSGNVFLKLKFPDGECVLNERNIDYDDSNTDIWNKNRQSIRVGRGIRSILTASGEKFNDSQIEDFVNKYKSAFDRMNDIYKSFELVSGDQIAHWYKAENYLYGTNRGTLGNSCMGCVPSSYFQIYTKNPEVCSLLILKSESDPSKIIGRALVWKLESSDGIIFMDRIYYTNDSEMQLFRDYAKFKKWHYKKYNDSSDGGYLISPEGEVIDTYLKVSIKAIKYTKYPYVDTLKYLDDNRTKSYTLCNNRDDDEKTLESTSGGYEGHDCDSCGGEGVVDCGNCSGRGDLECYDCDGYGTEDCGNCSGDGDIECDKCGGSGKDKNGKECDKCEGNEKVDCDDCDGSGKVDCNNCGGNGRIDCDDCGGRGTVDCPDCS